MPRMFVADRENDRIQIFTPEGEYLEEWTDVQRPMQLVCDKQGRAIVAELTCRAGTISYRNGPIAKHLSSRIAILDAGGAVLERLGDHGPTTSAGAPPSPPAGVFRRAHGLAIDPNGGASGGRPTCRR